MSEKEIVALLKSINIKIEALQSQMVMFQEALQPDLEYVEEEVKKVGFKKLPKSKKKLDAVKHKISNKPCRTCGGFISWDGFDKADPTPPLHVNKDGVIIGTGSCPEWEAES